MAGLIAAQIALVRKSYALALRHPRGFATVFYDRLFHDHPFVRALFSDDLDRQAHSLTATLSLIVAGLHDLSPILPTLRELARRHVGYGVHERHYAIVSTTLIDTFAQVLDDRFTAEARVAWKAAYDVVATAMIAAAYPAND